MKNVITFLMCSLCIITGIAQSDLSGNAIVIPERTPELEALYQQAKSLEENGTAAEINANRLAIKNAWQDIDPNMAALYKPIETTQYSQVGGSDGNFRPNIIIERPEQSRSPEDWDTDRLLRDDYIDGLDMDVTGSGDIYIAAFENFTGSGSDSNLYIYRSTDGGNTFTLWKDQPVISSFFGKIQAISMDGGGDDYLLVYSMFQNGVFQVLRWNMASGAFDFQTVASDVTDFGVDRNYPGSTNAQRVFATYQKTTSCTEVHSARSTAGSYGFDWVDEASLGTCAQQVEFSYGLNGACYATYTGATSGNLYAEVNSNYNDPASWGARETVIDGSVTEVLNPTIRAARLDLASDKVVIWASQRAAGSSNNFNGLGLKRLSGAAYVNFSNFPSGGTDWNIAHTDSWMRKINGAEEIRMAYVRDNIPDTDNDTNRSLTFNGTDFDPFEPVVDPTNKAFDGFPSVTAETADNLPCMAFAGTSSSGAFGFGLYFDAKTVLIGIDENSFEGFKFYPNPAQDVLKLSANNTIESVSMFSLLGQKVFETSIDQNETSINISSLTPGVYLMKVMIDGNSDTYKIVKQ